MRCHDPRISNDRDHKVETDNPALRMGELLRVRHHKILDWDVIAKQATIWDERVTKDEITNKGRRILLGENSKYP